MTRLLARNLTARDVVFHKNMTPRMMNEVTMSSFYSGMLHGDVTTAEARPHGAIALDLSDELNANGQLPVPEVMDQLGSRTAPFSYCRTCGPLARHVSALHRVPGRDSRPLQLLLDRRRGTRCIPNWPQLNSMLASWAASRGHVLVTPPPDWADISGAEQVRIVASSDVHIGIHGAAMSLSVFQPPGSLVIEILPRGFWYCRQSACLAHEGMLWVQLQLLEPASRNADLARRQLQTSRDIGRNVNVSGLIHALSYASDSDMWAAFRLPRNESCAIQTLPQWMRAWSGAGPAPHPGCREALPVGGFTPAYQGGTVPVTPDDSGAVEWPRCVSSILPL